MASRDYTRGAHDVHQLHRFSFPPSRNGHMRTPFEIFQDEDSTASSPQRAPSTQVQQTHNWSRAPSNPRPLTNGVGSVGSRDMELSSISSAGSTLYDENREEPQPVTRSAVQDSVAAPSEMLLHHPQPTRDGLGFRAMYPEPMLSFEHPVALQGALPLSLLSRLIPVEPASTNHESQSAGTGVRSHRLHRSVPVADLRSAASVSTSPPHDSGPPQNQLPRSAAFQELPNYSGSTLSTSVSVWGTPNRTQTENQTQRQIQTQVPRSVTVPNIPPNLSDISEFGALTTPGDSTTNPVTVDREGVNQWRRTTTTNDNLLRSPDTPRPFNREEIERAYRSSSSSSVISHLTVDEGDGLRLAADQAMQAIYRAQGLIPLHSVSSESTDDRFAPGPSSQPRVVLSPQKDEKGEGSADPAKKLPPPPLPLGAHPHPLRAKAANDDEHTYTIHGLTLALHKIFAPTSVPADVLAALPSPVDLADLTQPNTPTGANLMQRSQLSDTLRMALNPKDRNYLSFFIDNLLRMNKNLSDECKKLEDDVDEKELDKARLQTDINHWFHQAQIAGANGGERARLQQMIRFLWQHIHANMGMEAVGLADTLSIDLAAIIGGASSELVGMEQARIRGLVEDARYWRTRAEEAEAYLDVRRCN